MFNVQILIISSLGPEGSLLITPSPQTYVEGLPLVILGHLAEGHGQHYVRLDGTVSHYLETVLQTDREQLHQQQACISDNEEDQSNQSDHYCTNEEEEQDPISGGPADTIPVLPDEMFSMIIQHTLNMDMSMIGTFNRVCILFRELTARHLPRMYIRPQLADHLKISQQDDTDTSVMKVYKACGRGSGLAQQIKQLFSANKGCMRAWMTLSHLSFGHYKVKDLYWK